MINEFISEDYKNAITIKKDNVIIKRSKSFTEDGKEYERVYIDNGGKCMFLVEIITNTSVEFKVKGGLPMTERNKQHDTLVWTGTEEALTVDYTLLLDAINKSEGDKKEQLQALLGKLNGMKVNDIIKTLDISRGMLYNILRKENLRRNK